MNASTIAFGLSALLRRFPFRGKTWLWLRVERWLAPGQRVVRLPGGGRMLIDTARYWQRQMLAGCFERRSVWVVGRLLQPGDAFIDGGANCGLFSCLAAGVVGRSGRVVALEPDPRLHAQLTRQSELNPVIRVEPAALTRTRGHVEFHLPPDNVPDGWGLGIATIETRPGWTTVDVRATTLDDVVAAIDGPVALAKLDLEGHEGPALEGARGALASGRLESVLLEVNDSRGVAELEQYAFDAVIDVREGFSLVDPKAVGDRHTDLLFLRGAAWRRWQRARRWTWLM